MNTKNIIIRPQNSNKRCMFLQGIALCRRIKAANYVEASTLEDIGLGRVLNETIHLGAFTPPSRLYFVPGHTR